MISEILADLHAWLEAHPDAPIHDVIRVSRAIKILEGIDE